MQFKCLEMFTITFDMVIRKLLALPFTFVLIYVSQFFELKTKGGTFLKCWNFKVLKQWAVKHTVLLSIPECLRLMPWVERTSSNEEHTRPGFLWIRKISSIPAIAWQFMSILDPWVNLSFQPWTFDKRWAWKLAKSTSVTWTQNGTCTMWLERFLWVFQNS